MADSTTIHNRRAKFRAMVSDGMINAVFSPDDIAIPADNLKYRYLVVTWISDEKLLSPRRRVYTQQNRRNALQGMQLDAANALHSRTNWFYGIVVDLDECVVLSEASYKTPDRVTLPKPSTRRKPKILFHRTIPTYHANRDDPFDKPDAVVAILEDTGLRVLLGSHDAESECADLLIERHLGGWSVIIHPVGWQDPAGFVSILDSGQVFATPECQSSLFILLPPGDTPLGLDKPKE